MATYQKLNDCPQTFTIKQHNSAIDSSTLTVLEVPSIKGDSVSYTYNLYNGSSLTLGTRKDVYIGFSDDSGNFEGNQPTTISLTSDTTGCSATATKVDNTACSVIYSLNSCLKDRVITFSYNSTPIFKISQTYYKQSITNYVYAFNISSFRLNNSYYYAWFDDNSPTNISVTNTNKYLMYYYDDLSTNYSRSYIFFYYTSKQLSFATDLTVSDIIDQLTHVSGNNSLSGYGRYYYLDVPYNVNSYNNGNPTTISVSESSTICLYRYQSSMFTKIATITINADTKNYHLGKYKYTNS